jgi:hypothetical protein
LRLVNNPARSMIHDLNNAFLSYALTNYHVRFIYT